MVGGEEMVCLCMIKPLPQLNAVIGVLDRLRNMLKQACEDSKFNKIKTIELKNFQYATAANKGSTALTKLSFGLCVHTILRNCLFFTTIPYCFHYCTVPRVNILILSPYFRKINELNLSFQGTTIKTTLACEKLKFSSKK
jgi:hypothetical protein